MSIGEIVSALSLCCSNIFSGDELLFCKNVYSVEVEDTRIKVYFVDANTADIEIYKDGTWEYLE